MRGYLVGQQLTIAGSRPRRNCAAAFPLLDAELHKLSDRYFVGLAALRKVACLVIGCLSWQTHLFVGLRDDHGVGNRGAYVSYYDKFGSF